MAYLQAKYGIAFPKMNSEPTAAASSSSSEVNSTPSPEDTPQTVAWADSRFPSIDYTLPPFELANREGQKISGWWTIETSTAAVDDSPSVLAVNHSLFSPNNYSGQTALAVRCFEGETALIFVQDEYLRSDFRRNSFQMTVRIDDQPAEQTTWSSLTSNKGAGLFGNNAKSFLRKIYDAERLFVRLTEKNGENHDALFQLAGAQDAFDAAAAACGWTTLALSADDYRAIQTMLNSAGFDTGTPDGQWGPTSQKAMRAFQASIGLPETGAPDRATLEQLGISQ